MFKIRNSPKLNKPGQASLGLEHWNFGHSNLFRISKFEFRIFSLPSWLVGLPVPRRNRGTGREGGASLGIELPAYPFSNWLRYRVLRFCNGRITTSNGHYQRKSLDKNCYNTCYETIWKKVVELASSYKSHCYLQG